MTKPHRRPSACMPCPPPPPGLLLTAFVAVARTATVPQDVVAYVLVLSYIGAWTSVATGSLHGPRRPRRRSAKWPLGWGGGGGGAQHWQQQQQRQQHNSRDDWAEKLLVWWIKATLRVQQQLLRSYVDWGAGMAAAQQAQHADMWRPLWQALLQGPAAATAAPVPFWGWHPQQKQDAQRGARALESVPDGKQRRLRGGGQEQPPLRPPAGDWAGSTGEQQQPKRQPQEGAAWRSRAARGSLWAAAGPLGAS